MGDAPSHYWQDLTSAEVARLDPRTTVTLLPVGAIEQHGPHLPLSVDAVINEAVVERAAALIGGDPCLLVLPMISVGLSPEHADFPGTLSLSPATLLRTLVEIGESVARAGLRKLVLFNSHGGQPQILDLAAQELRARRAMLAVTVNVYRLWRAADLFPEAEARHGIHAGAVETSIMLELRPDLVRRRHVRRFDSRRARLERDAPAIGPGGPASLAWQAQDLNPAGAAGDATIATAAHGRRLLDEAARGLADVIRDLARLPLDTADPGP